MWILGAYSRFLQGLVLLLGKELDSGGLPRFCQGEQASSGQVLDDVILLLLLGSLVQQNLAQGMLQCYSLALAQMQN